TKPEVHHVGVLWTYVPRFAPLRELSKVSGEDRTRQTGTWEAPATAGSDPKAVLRAQGPLRCNIAIIANSENFYLLGMPSPWRRDFSPLMAHNRNQLCAQSVLVRFDSRSKFAVAVKGPLSKGRFAMGEGRTLLGWFGVVLMAAASGAASAQDAGSYPAKPVTVVIPTAASVSGDILMRAFGEAVSKHLGQPIVVDNKPGGSGALAAAYV